MAYIIKMPKLGLEMEQGTVLEWYVESGDEVAEGDTLAEIESEKSIGEVDAREDGVLRHVYIEEEGSVPPGTPIGILAAADEDISDLQSQAEAELEDEAPDSVTADSTTAEETAEMTATTDSPETSGGGSATATTDDTQTGATADTQRGAQKVSPRARERADELGVDLATVEGTGFDGAVTEDDVEAAAESDGAATGAESDATAARDVKASPRARERADELGVDLTTVEGTGFDGAVTEDDVEAAAETATAATDAAGSGVQVAAEAEAGRYRQATAVADPAAGEALFETMEAVRVAFEERVTMTDVLAVVVSAALTDHPVVNGTYTESTHQVQDRQDIALVADSDGDRVAGVIGDIERRSLTEIVEARQELDGSGAADGGRGATFTLANAADAEVEGKLLNPPAVAALAVDPTGQRAVPDGDGVDLQPLVTASLTYDTRAVGENEARAFLDAVFERGNEASELVLGSYRGTE